MSAATAKSREPLIFNDSYDVEKFLRKKKMELTDLISDKRKTMTEEKVRKLISYRDSISEILDMHYFHDDYTYYILELIAEIKKEREELLIELKKCEEELNQAKSLLREAEKKVNGYMANRFEGDYLSPEQVDYRRKVDDYQSIEYAYETIQKERRLMWYLLGIIHRPAGFFKKIEE